MKFNIIGMFILLYALAMLSFPVGAVLMVLFCGNGIECQ